MQEPDDWDGEGGGAVSGPSGDHPRPLRPDRVRASLDRLGYHYFVDQAGDAGGIWGGRLFQMFVLGSQSQVFQVRGRWNRRIALERLVEVLAHCDRWNREYIWPKTYVRVLDDGFIHVMTEVSTSFAAGVTDAQLAACVRNGLAAGGIIFDSLDQEFPDPAERGA